MLLWVGAAALVVRFFYFSEHASSAFFHVAILDEKFYQALARALVDGHDVSELNPGFRPWAYPFFLAACFRLAGDWGYVLALAVQHLLGILTAVLVADLAIRLFRRPMAGALAGGLYVLAGPPLFFEGELLITGLFTFLTTALLWILSRADPADPHAIALWLGAGMCTGLAAQARPNALLFLAAFPAAAFLVRRGSPARRWTLAASALAGALAVVLAFAYAQERLIGRFQLLAGAGGVNFYLGNKTGADGMIPRQDRRVTYGEEYRDSVQVFAEELFREELGEGASDAPAADVSRYWLGRTLEDIADDPSGWLALLGRKILFLVWNREIPNNKSYDFIVGHESRLLNLLPVRWWLLLSLGVLGLLYALGPGDRPGAQRRILFWVAAFLALHGLGIVLFFVNSRFRIPMWPGMAVLAAGGILALVERVRQRSLPDLAVAGLTAGGLAVVSLVNWLQIEPESYARDYFFRSLAHMEKGQVEEAHADAFASVQIDSVAPAARFHLGNVVLARGDDDLAFRHYRVAANLSPPEPRIFNNLGVVIEGRGRPAAAYRYYLRALAIAGDYPPALINAALLELRAGLLDRAEEKIEKAEALRFESVLLECARAFLERDRGHGDEAAKILERASLEDFGRVEKLIEENRRRFSPERLGIVEPTAP